MKKLWRHMSESRILLHPAAHGGAYALSAAGAFLLMMLFSERGIFFYLRYRIYYRHEIIGMILYDGALALFVLMYAAGAAIACLHGARHAQKTRKGHFGLFTMPLEMCVLLYGAVEWGLLAFLPGVYGVVFFVIGFVLLAVVPVHFLENTAERVKRGDFFENSLIYGIRSAAASAGLRIPFLVKCGIILGILMLVLLSAAQKLWDYAYSGISVLTFLAAIGVPAFLWYLCWSFEQLQKGSEKLVQGGDSSPIDTGRLIGVMKRHGENLNSIGEGVNRAVEARLKSERLKTELITNVSHDIKTPLTSVINYADLICREDTENPRIKEYAQVLERQSQKLKRLIENLIEASKASTGNVKIDLKPCNLNVLLSQMAGEYESRLAEKRLTLVTAPPAEEIMVLADGSQLWRVFDNLMGNICKYALEGTRVYVDICNREQVEIVFKNVSREQLNLTEEELMERFTRGDEARSTGGNGLGLSIAQSLMKLQNGSLHLVIDGDLFKAVVSLEHCQKSGKNKLDEDENPDF